MKKPKTNCTTPLFLCSFLMYISHYGFAKIDTKTLEIPEKTERKMRGRASPMNLEAGKQSSST
jgi:hypothetical protein